MNDAKNDDRKVNRLTYRTKLVAGICSLVIAAGVITTWISARSAERSTRVMVDRLFREASEHASSHTRAHVMRTGPVLEMMRSLAQRGLRLDAPDELQLQLLAIFNSHDGLSWVSYGDESGRFTGVHRTGMGAIWLQQTQIVDGRTELVEHEVLADGSLKLVKREEDTGYDPRTRPYYKNAVATDEIVWSEPYVFYEGMPGISCSVRVDDPAGQLRGVFSVDFNLQMLSEFVSELAVSENSQTFLFTDDGELLAHPSLLLSKSSEAGATRLTKLDETDNALLQSFERSLAPSDPSSRDASGEPDDEFRFSSFEHDGQTYLGSTTSFPIGRKHTWMIGVMAPAADFLSGIWRTQAIGIVIALVALLLAVVVAMFLARRISGPIEALIAVMRKVGSGDLEARADLGNSPEFREVSTALNRMILDLRDRLRLRHSLEVAMQVQQQLLPREPPRIPGIDLAGHSTYCDETGGDYYDFLLVDDVMPGKVIVALGDVMGHGVAAALVMAGARAVLRDRAVHDRSLPELMQRLNRLLSSDLDGSRFMTMYLAMIDRDAEVIRWVSAGHDPAIIYDLASDEFQEIEGADLPLGIMEDEEYTEHEYSGLRPNQVVVIGTDGVWEMQNAAGEFFGKERLRAIIRQEAMGSAEDVSQAIRRHLSAFRGESRATDDVTFLVVRTMPEAELAREGTATTGAVPT